MNVNKCQKKVGVLIFKKWCFVTKIVLTYCEKKSLEQFQFIQPVKGFLVTECLFNLFLEVSHN